MQFNWPKLERCRTSWRSWPRCRCTPSRPAATASAISPPITSPASRPMRSTIRGPTARSSASGPRSIRIQLPAAQVQDRRDGRRHDRAASEVHDVGVHSSASARRRLRDPGRRRPGPHADLGQVIREFLPQADLLAYLEAVLRVYNRHGRRDNIHKARIKILVRALGVAAFRARSRPSSRPPRARAAAGRSRSGSHARFLRAAAVRAPDRTSTLPARPRRWRFRPGTATTPAPTGSPAIAP